MSGMDSSKAVGVLGGRLPPHHRRRRIATNTQPAALRLCAAHSVRSDTGPRKQRRMRGEWVDWPTAAVLIALIIAVMVIASTYIASHGQKP